MSRFWRCDRCEKEFQKDSNCVSLDNCGSPKLVNIRSMDFCPECSMQFAIWLTEPKAKEEAADAKKEQENSEK